MHLAEKLPTNSHISYLKFYLTVVEIIRTFLKPNHLSWGWANHQCARPVSRFNGLMNNRDLVFTNSILLNGLKE